MLPEWAAERRHGLAVAGLLAFVFLVTGAIVLVDAIVGVERLRALVEEAGPWAPLVYVAVKAVTLVLVPFSSAPLKVASGALFGLWGGIALTALADTLGGCACYGLSRLLGRRAAAKLVGDDRMARVDELLDYGLGSWRELLFARLVLHVPYNLFSFAAGLTATLPFRQYLAVTLLSHTVPNVFSVGAGAGLAAGWGAKAAVFGGLAALGVAALLTQRRIRDALARALRLKSAAEGRPQGRDTHKKGPGHNLRAEACPEEIDPESGGGPA